ncbi:uncharacterized protein CANTADRAFT_3685 [Suhomyces tanzawaensis NRRL Y-17324]|uniref:Uncharacterized protein n=1 Tax=Suhomyces tanzawaensis NRRL Y-17324 TaxID=984487 RepID=A0A1E4SQ06_9ASCO|nr:uncharacterized protein CANTADRAFT_3685 [Suhomyces tanzawaensis NRRL Y-17324]ODV81591.1 hypothetical protein CANTADRAFT_3685 [Suhomyces tanzawaensis NRRL Y-17324]
MEFSTPQRNEKYDSANVSGTSSNTTPIVSVTEDAHPSAIRSHRTKLSSQDIKLILYLISSIKPFKYIGDRSLSQTKKWEAIQQRYGQIKRMDGDASEAVVIPTIRTLQRQLSSAIKKALMKRLENKRLGKFLYHEEQDIEAEEARIDQEINMDSALPELENALLELNDLSDRYRSGKDGKSHKADSPRIRDLHDPHNEPEDHQHQQATLGLIRAEIESLLPKDNEKSHGILKSVDLIQTFLQELLKIQTKLNMENAAILDETERLVKSQQAYVKKVREFSENYDKSLAGLRNSVVSNVVEYLIEMNDTEHTEAVRKTLLSLKESIE